MSSMYKNDYIYDKHIYEKPYIYDNPYMSYDSAQEGSRCPNHLSKHQHRSRLTAMSVHPQHSYRPVASVMPTKQHRQHELIASAATLSADIDLHAMFKRSGHMSADRHHNKYSVSGSHSKAGFKASTIHGQHRTVRPLPSLPSVVSNNSFSTLNESRHHKQHRSDIFSTAATLSSIHSTDSKGPLRPFWETPLYDMTTSLSDCDSVGPTGSTTKTRSLCRYFTVCVICLAIVLLAVSLIAFIALSTANTNTENTTTQLSNSIPVPEENERSALTDSPLLPRQPAVHHQEKEEQNKRIDVKLMQTKDVEQSTTTTTTTTTVKNRNRGTNSGLKAFWSNWSEWSPCRGVNRDCDPGRIHSRIRKCMTENGDVVNSDICRVNSGQQQELEIRDCQCNEQSGLAHVNTTNINLTNILIHTTSASQTEKPDRVCNDCKQDEICLLLVKAAVPFCAKIKDPRDPRGCGGWCSGHKELCRYVGAQTYQCVDDSECLEDEWQCANGLCIPASRNCDGHFNCFDMSDEMHCNCKEDEFHCGNNTSCLPLSQKCDGIIHCWDGEDEQNCTKVCTENQFTCNSGQCIPIESFCDSHKHCDDGSDEPDGCNVSVCKSKDEFQCGNGRCVPKSGLCDSIDNCGDYSDENDCKQTANNWQTKPMTRPLLSTTISDVLNRRRVT